MNCHLHEDFQDKITQQQNLNDGNEFHMYGVQFKQCKDLTNYQYFVRTYDHDTLI